MLKEAALEDILVFDIETVPMWPEFAELPADMQQMWEKKMSRYLDEQADDKDLFFERAGIYAEFGKIICISAGIFRKNEMSGQMTLRLKSFNSKDEKILLNDFAELLAKYFNKPEKHTMAGHNIKEFDIPYLCRRFLIHGFNLPNLLDIQGRKPWETKFIDTMELWKFGDRKNYTSLQLLAALFKIPTPKGDIAGSDVARVFWKEDGLDRIVEYCQKDVVTVAQLILKFKGLKMLPDESIIHS